MSILDGFLRRPKKQTRPPRQDAFQDWIPNNHCFGCGSGNAHGLKLKSRWAAEGESVCRFRPQRHHCAGPSKYVNGGIIATIIDCHCICTAFAYAYEAAGRRSGDGKPLSFATGSLNVNYLKPAPIDREILLRAKVEEATERKIRLSCSLISHNEERATAEVLAVAVPADW